MLGICVRFLHRYRLVKEAVGSPKSGTQGTCRLDQCGSRLPHWCDEPDVLRRC